MELENLHKMLIVSFVYLISWLRAYWLIFRRKSFEKIWERIENGKIIKLHQYFTKSRRAFFINLLTKVVQD
jgi:hypothetical protein